MSPAAPAVDAGGISQPEKTKPPDLVAVLGNARWSGRPRGLLLAGAQAGYLREELEEAVLEAELALLEGGSGFVEGGNAFLQMSLQAFPIIRRQTNVRVHLIGGLWARVHV